MVPRGTEARYNNYAWCRAVAHSGALSRGVFIGGGQAVTGISMSQSEPRDRSNQPRGAVTAGEADHRFDRGIVATKIATKLVERWPALPSDVR